MSKYAAINTLDYRLAMMGFSHPDSTQLKVYRNSSGDMLINRNGCFGNGWYWYRHDIGYQEYRSSKRSLVQLMEAHYGKNKN